MADIFHGYTYGEPKVDQKCPLSTYRSPKKISRKNSP